MTIKINPLQEAITEAEIARHTFCLASPGTDEEFTAFLSGFDAALGIFRNAIEKGGDASDQGNSDPRHDTSTGVTAGAVDPAAIRAEALREIDLSRADRGDHPDIKTDETMYLACIAGVWFFGPFSRQWYGLNFTRWGNTGCQFDAPGTNASRWERVIEVNLDALITKGGDQ